MRVLLVNPPYRCVTSDKGLGHQTPLGLLCIGGPLIDAGHTVRLHDAELLHSSDAQLLAAMAEFMPDVVMTGHAGSTPAHLSCLRVLAVAKRHHPQVLTVYGGVYPTYHAADILHEHACVDVVVRGEGEAIALALVNALAQAWHGAAQPVGEQTEVHGQVQGQAHGHEHGHGQAQVRMAAEAGEHPQPAAAAAARPGQAPAAHQASAPPSPAMAQLDWRAALREVDGISHLAQPWGADADGAVVAHPDAPLMRDLDNWRVGWELVEDWDAYQCFGIGRAAVYQFSRGCPHQCSYCGQYQFWEKWRYRSPKRAAAEIAWLHRTFGIEFIDLADENPTSSRKLWRAFLQAIVDEGVHVKMFATIRATDIVRDADFLDLAARAGVICVLMGIETTDEATLAAIRKGSTTAEDQAAVGLLRQHGIMSMLGHIVGFAEESFSDYRRALRQIAHYDPDLLNAMYVTPHRWSDWSGEHAERLVVQEDPSKWDYRHQLLGSRHLKPWQIFALVKWMELRIHLRPKALWRILNHRDPGMRRYLRWCFVYSARVWLHEVAEFVLHTRTPRQPRSLRDWFRAKRPAGAPNPVGKPVAVPVRVQRG